MMPNAARPLSASAQKVQDDLRARGFGNTVIELEVPVKTAAAAAEGVGCEVAQIVKSLVFRGTHTGDAVLVVASGANRVDTAKLAALLGEDVAMADPRLVRELTGFAIGGIPPVGHTSPLPVYIDQHLTTLPDLWAAAGHPNSLFRLTPDELVRMTNGRVCELA